MKLFSNDTALLNQLGPRVGDAISKIPGVVDVENGIDNTISGPATNFQVDPIVASRMGFTPAEVSDDATCDPRWNHHRSAHCQWTRVQHPRAPLPTSIAPRSRRLKNTVFNSASGHTATLGSLADGRAVAAAE